VGVFYFMFYTATGLVALPLDMIRSRFKRDDSDDTEAQLTNIRERQDAIRRKAQTRKKGRGGGSMSTADRRNLERLQHEERVVSQATRRADKLQNGICTKISIIFRPFEFVFGIAFFLLSLFLVATLALSSGDKLLQITQQNLNWKTGG
jgi:LMBR1 domain-containing protein 1